MNYCILLLFKDWISKNLNSFKTQTYKAYPLLKMTSEDIVEEFNSEEDNMLKKITLFILFLTLFMVLTGGSASANQYGTIAVESKSVEPGDQFKIDVTLSGNTESIQGLFIPLKFDNPDLIYDSVSFENTVLTSNFVGVAGYQSEINNLWITYMPDISNPQVDSILTPNGLIASIYFTVSDFPSPATVAIDSLNEITYTSDSTYYVINVNMSAADGESLYYPEFQGGAITILVPTAVEDDLNLTLPNEYHLSQNYPNPFNPSTNIRFSLPTAGPVKLEVYNVLGQHVATLVDRQMSAGTHEVEFDGSNQSSGIFFYRLIHAQGTETKKMIMVK